jgi:hypothetical protein
MHMHSGVTVALGSEPPRYWDAARAPPRRRGARGDARCQCHCHCPGAQAAAARAPGPTRPPRAPVRANLKPRAAAAANAATVTGPLLAGHCALPPTDSLSGSRKVSTGAQ